MIKVTVYDEDQLDSYNTTNKNTGEIRQRYKQIVWFHLGGRHPEKGNIPIETPNLRLPAGEYEFAMSSFRIGRFGGLEVDDFNIKLEPINKPALTKAS